MTVTTIEAESVLDFIVKGEQNNRKYEYLVTFHRNGDIKHGYRFKPSPEAYRKLDELPNEVVEAARKARSRS